MSKLITVSAVGVLVGATMVVTISIIGWVILPRILAKDIQEKIKLSNPEALAKWKNANGSVQLKFYVFNVTNTHHLLEGKKLKFTEHGPYVYDEKRIKTVLRRDNYTATYKETRLFYFNKESSAGSENDHFNILNVPFISLAHVGYDTQTEFNFTKLKLLIASLVESGESIVKGNVSLRELLFEGWKLPPHYSVMPVTFSESIHDLRFGFFRGLNGSETEEFVVKTGDDHVKYVGQILTWKGQKELSWWNDTGAPSTTGKSPCNQINATDGFLYQPFIKKGTILRDFSPQFCRSFSFVFHSELTYRDVPALKFIRSNETFSTTLNYNKCFDRRQSPKLTSTKHSGLMRAFPCKFGAPIVFSNPHFLHGDIDLFQDISMDFPVPEQHETFMEVEPQSGKVLCKRNRMQYNVELQNFPQLPQFKDLDFSKYSDNPSLFLPILWQEEDFDINGKDADMMYHERVKSKANYDAVKWGVIVIGYAVAFICGIIFMMAMRKLER